MKKVVYILMSVIVLNFSMTGCKDWMDINTSPDNPVTVSCNVVLPSLLFFTIQQCFDNTEYQNYLAQAITTTGRTPKVEYSYRGGWGGFPDMNRHPHWRRHYYEIGVNADYMIEDALKQTAYNYALIGYTLKLHSLMITTDEFGEMPYDEAYKSNTPKYDTQEHIYEELEKEFYRVIALYNDPAWYAAPTNPVISDKIDRMYAGDMDKYRCLTYALFARYWVRHIPNWGAGESHNLKAACDSVIKYVDLALNSWAEPLYKFDGGTGEKTSMWGPYHSSQATMNLGWPQGRENALGGAVPTEFLASILGFYPAGANSLKKTKGVSSMYALDPRAGRMFQARSGYDKDPIAMRSLKANIGSDVQYNKNYKAENFPDMFCNTSDSTKAIKASYRANPYTKDDGYICIITKEEMMFGKAEALYWKGDKQAAYNLMMEAVNHNMERYNVAAGFAGYPDGNIETLMDIFKKMRLDYSNFGIDMLMQQKFVAMYLQPEQWSDIRRYNYSAKSNGIMYDNTYVYDVQRVPKSKKEDIDPNKPESYFSQTYELVRPYNLYQPHFLVEGKDFITGANFTLTPNAWINRLNPDPETEDKYNRAELEKMNAYKNPDYLRKRMVWQRDFGTGAITNKGIPGVEWQ